MVQMVRRRQPVPSGSCQTCHQAVDIGRLDNKYATGFQNPTHSLENLVKVGDVFKNVIHGYHIKGLIAIIDLLERTGMDEQVEMFAPKRCTFLVEFDTFNIETFSSGTTEKQADITPDVQEAATCDEPF